MNDKVNVALLFGGKSVEHEVSIQSALSVAHALNPNAYLVHFIGIDKEGNWNYYDSNAPAKHEDNPFEIALGKKRAPVDLFSLSNIDVVFPILHGALGEDGTVQGLLRLANIPFVGSDVLGSAIGMNKDIAKRLVSLANIPTSRWTVLVKNEEIHLDALTFPLFVKPVSSGSSIGIAKVYEPSALASAVEMAFRYDEKVLLEEAIKGREIQVAVMGNAAPIASLPCEIIPKGEFHTYESKYIDPQGADFFYPAPLDADEIQQIKMTALQIYRTLNCEGFARVDFFLTSDGTIVFNEVNTIPGLTAMSPYPKMWASSGVSYSAMIDQLIHFALERHKDRSSIVTCIESVNSS